MLEQLFNLVKENAQESVINNNAVPNEQNENVIAEATNTVASGLQNLLSGGGLQNILGLFGGGNQAQLTKNPIVNMMIGHFVNKLTGKFGLQPQAANGIAGQLIPSILSNLIKKTNDPSDNSFNINNIIGALAGGGANQQAPAAGGFDFGNIVSKIAQGGLDANNDGQLGLDDVIAKIAGGAQQQVAQQNQSSGGLMDLIKGFVK